MLFWITIIAPAVGVAFLLARSLVSGRIGSEPSAACDRKVYRDQLRDLDRDLARGVVAPDEASRLRTEISRRILAADTKLARGMTKALFPSLRSRAPAALVLLTVLAASALLYMQLGAPGYSDRPPAARMAETKEARTNLPAQKTLIEAANKRGTTPAEASEDFETLMKQPRVDVDDFTSDIEVLAFMTRNEASLGNMAAVGAQRRAVEIKKDGATASDHAVLAELLIAAAGGVVSTKVGDALRTALQKNPSQSEARYYLGYLFLQIARPDGALRIWDASLRDSSPNPPWAIHILALFQEVAARAGQRNYTPLEAPAMPGPGADAFSAAEGMSNDERAEFVGGMVARLSDRLATQGGTVAEWARLITMHGALGDIEQARAVHDEAFEIFSENIQAISMIRAAGARAGATE